MKVKELIEVLQTMPRYNGVDPQECEVYIPDYFDGLIPVSTITVQTSHGNDNAQLDGRVIVIVE
jgi:hypothetical protein